MKGMIIIAILVTLAFVFIQYKRNRDTRKLMIILASFAVIISLGIAGNLTRPIIPIFIAHLVLVVVAWGSVWWYMMRDRYYWWLILSPAVTIALFLILEVLIGSGHEYLGELT